MKSRLLTARTIPSQVALFLIAAAVSAAPWLYSGPTYSDLRYKAPLRRNCVHNGWSRCLAKAGHIGQNYCPYLTKPEPRSLDWTFQSVTPGIRMST